MNPSSLFGLCELYLFVWREKVIPTLIAVMISLNRNKATSKIFVFKGTDFNDVNNFTVGAKTSVLNTTTKVR